MDAWEYNSAKDIGVAPMQRLRSEVREPGLVSHMIGGVSWAAMRVFFRVYNRLEIRGVEHLPTKPPFVVVANHASHLDALVLGACIPRALRHIVYPIAAGDVFFESAARMVFAATTINALPIWRKRVGGHALDDLKQRLHSGECAFILFPEGARTRDGTPLRWKPGIGMMVAGTKIPVVPCKITGCFESLRPETKVPRPCKMVVEMTPPIEFSDLPNDRTGWEKVAATLKERVVGVAASSEEPPPSTT